MLSAEERLARRPRTRDHKALGGSWSYLVVQRYGGRPSFTRDREACMWIRHSYLGTSRSDARCLFFLLYEDYIEAQSSFARELDVQLERFARRIGDNASLVRPFLGDVETARSEVLTKNWTPDQLDEVKKTPALLLIAVDFDSFDPQEHPWYLLNLGSHIINNSPDVAKFSRFFDELAAAVNDREVDVFERTHAIAQAIDTSEAAKIFEAKPGIFGFSVDLIKAGEVFTQLVRRYGRRHAAT